MADPVFNTSTASTGSSVFSEADTRYQCNGNGTWTFPESPNKRGSAAIDVDVSSGKKVLAFALDSKDASDGSSTGGGSAQRVGLYGDAVTPYADGASGTNANEYVFNCNTGDKRNNNTNTAYGSQVSPGEKLVVAWDASSGTGIKIWFGSESGGTITWFDSGDPAAGTGYAWDLDYLTYSAFALVVNDASSSWCSDTDVLTSDEASLSNIPSGFTYLGTVSGPTATITKNFSGTEYIPAHFAFSGWTSTPGTGSVHEMKFKWTVSGGSEHDGVFSGPNLGLVWETSGTFTVQLDVEDTNGDTDNASTTVTVGTPSFDRSIYVATAGNDTTGDGSIGTPYATLDKAWTVVTAAHGADEHSRILLNNGDSFTLSAKIEEPATGSGTFYFDTYGSGANPSVTSASYVFDTLNDTNKTFGWKVSGIDFEATGSSSAFNIKADDANAGARGLDFVMSDCEVYMSGTALACFAPGSESGTRVETAYEEANYTGLANVANLALQNVDIITDNTYGMFGEAQWITLNGGKVEKTAGGGGEHCMRMPWMRNSSIRGVSFYSAHDTTTLLRIQSSSYAGPIDTISHYVTVEGCTFYCGAYLAIDAGYVNSASTRCSGRLAMLNNVFLDHQSEPYGGSVWVAMHTYGDAVAIVGNTVHGNSRLLGLIPEASPLVDATNRIFVANNSIESDTAATAGQININSTYLSTLTVQNNAVNSASSRGILQGDSDASNLTNLTCDYNVVNCSSWVNNTGKSGTQTLSGWQVYASEDANSYASDPGFSDAANGDFSISAESDCYEAGTDLQASWLDMARTTRTSPWDIGAVEKSTPADTDAPSAPSDMTWSVSNLTVSLSWADNSDDETGFVVQRNDGWGAAYVTVSEVESGTTSIDDIVPKAGDFWYRIYATNVHGNSSAAVTEVHVPVVSTPTTIIAVTEVSRSIEDHARMVMKRKTLPSASDGLTRAVDRTMRNGGTFYRRGKK